MNDSVQRTVNTPDRRQALYAEMAPLNLTPLWEVLHSLVPSQPAQTCVPSHWKYDEVRPFLIQAGEAISAEEAVRRVLILENPALRGQSAVTQSLYAGLQLIKPGEHAPSHRHTQSALRFVVEGTGAFTSVNGERTTMQPGDFIITPAWAWHEHGHPAADDAQPVVWLDGLDIPMLQFFDAGFAQSEAPPAFDLRPEGISFASYGYNMRPVRQTSPFGRTSPIFCYPYQRSREALAHLERMAPIDAWDGFKLQYLNPQTGGSPIPTMTTFLQRVPHGFLGKPHRQTDGTVYSVVEGYGEVLIEHGEKARCFKFGPKDHFVIPSWHTARFSSDGGCVLFGFSDRAVHEALGIHKEERFS